LLSRRSGSGHCQTAAGAKSRPFLEKLSASVTYHSGTSAWNNVSGKSAETARAEKARATETENGPGKQDQEHEQVPRQIAVDHGPTFCKNTSLKSNSPLFDWKTRTGSPAEGALLIENHAHLLKKFDRFGGFADEVEFFQ
jgi:hypothetical protein